MVNTAEVEVLFPQSSVAVNVTVALPVNPQSSLNAVKSLDQVTSLQTSLASAPPLFANHAFKASRLPAPSHSTVSSAESTSMLGAVVSSMVNRAEVDVALPHASVAVKTTKADPVAPQSSLSASKSFDQVTPLQTSLAEAPPLFANHAFKASMFPEPSHSTTSSEASTSMLGAVVSSMVNVAVVDEARPQPSVAVKVTVTEPVAPHSSLNASKSLDQVTPLQTSPAMAPPLLANQAFKASTFPAPSHSTTSSEASTSMLGAVVSSMVKVAVVEVALPQSSVAVNVTVAEPVAAHSSLRASKSLDHVTALQTSLAIAPALFANQAFNASKLPAPSHSTVSSIAETSMDGAVVSSMVKVAVVVDVFPQSSEAVKVTSAEPVAPQSSLRDVKSLDQVTTPQRSDARAPPLLSNHALKASAFPAPSHSTTSSKDSTSMDGEVVSMTVMIWASAVKLLPASSVAVNVREMV